jgi:hypothetical protein
MFSTTRWIVVSSVATVLAAAGCVRPSASASSSVCFDVPPELAVPSGHDLAFELFADGVQVYRCADTPGPDGAHSPAWMLQAPEATLITRHGVYAGRHRAGPTWEALDGSRVVATKVESAPSERAAIPWLLLRATTHAGPDGTMADITFVQRVATSGGNAPSNSCTRDTLGTTARVPYRGVYCFYRANDRIRGAGTNAESSSSTTRSVLLNEYRKQAFVQE